MPYEKIVNQVFETQQIFFAVKNIFIRMHLIIRIRIYLPCSSKRNVRSNSLEVRRDFTKLLHLLQWNIPVDQKHFQVGYEDSPVIQWGTGHIYQGSVFSWRLNCCNSQISCGFCTHNPWLLQSVPSPAFEIICFN